MAARGLPPVEGRPGWYYCRGAVCAGRPRHARHFGFGEPRGGRLRNWEVCVRCALEVQRASSRRYYKRNIAKFNAKTQAQYEPFAWAKDSPRGWVSLDLMRPVILEVRSQMTIRAISEHTGATRAVISCWTGNQRRVRRRMHRKYACAMVRLAADLRAGIVVGDKMMHDAARPASRALVGSLPEG